MRLLVLALLLPCAASAQDVARLFARPVAAAEIAGHGDNPFYQSRILYTLVWKEVEQRFVAAQGLRATEADFAALARYQQEVRKARRDYYARELADAEAGLQSPWLALPWIGEKRRRQLESAKARYQRLIEGQKHFAAPTGRHPDEIEAAKATKALYEKYGGAVAINLVDEPYPLGARNTLLREHERAGELQILHDGLRAEFWRLAERPAQRMAKPEEIDFTYFWLKPVPKKYSDPKNAL